MFFFNNLNRRSLIITARSLFICFTFCDTRWYNFSTFVTLYSIHIPYRPSLHCASRKYSIIEPRQLQLFKPYALGFLQQIKGTTSSPIHNEKRDHRLKTTLSERNEYENLVDAVRQTRKKHCRSKRADSIIWFWLTVVVRFYTQPPWCYVTQSQSRNDLCRRNQIDVWENIFFIDRVITIFGSNNYFALECSSQTEISHQCRCRIADQLSDNKTMVDTKKPRQKDPDRQIRTIRRFNIIEKKIISVNWKRNWATARAIKYEITNKKIRFYR